MIDDIEVVINDAEPVISIDITDALGNELISQLTLELNNIKGQLNMLQASHQELSNYVGISSKSELQALLDLQANQ